MRQRRCARSHPHLGAGHNATGARRRARPAMRGPHQRSAARSPSARRHPSPAERPQDSRAPAATGWQGLRTGSGASSMRACLESRPKATACSDSQREPGLPAHSRPHREALALRPWRRRAPYSETSRRRLAQAPVLRCTTLLPLEGASFRRPTGAKASWPTPEIPGDLISRRGAACPRFLSRRFRTHPGSRPRSLSLTRRLACRCRAGGRAHAPGPGLLRRTHARCWAEARGSSARKPLQGPCLGRPMRAIVGYTLRCRQRAVAAPGGSWLRKSQCVRGHPNRCRQQAAAGPGGSGSRGRPTGEHRRHPPHFLLARQGGPVVPGRWAETQLRLDLVHGIPTQLASRHWALGDVPAPPPAPAKLHRVRKPPGNYERHLTRAALEPRHSPQYPQRRCVPKARLAHPQPPVLPRPLQFCAPPRPPASLP
mmetsp:Transcript_17072/g.49465  ORF Transcript_17072/g.49465 Transcript_17072/m.49465 type:complete len:426 (-) Transcript_17072:818-2095(-)